MCIIEHFSPFSTVIGVYYYIYASSPETAGPILLNFFVQNSQFFFNSDRVRSEWLFKLSSAHCVANVARHFMRFESGGFYCLCFDYFGFSLTLKVVHCRARNLWKNNWGRLCNSRENYVRFFWKLLSCELYCNSCPPMCQCDLKHACAVQSITEAVKPVQASKNISVFSKYY